MKAISFNRTQIAPCGINCGTCYAFLRKKNNCPGCLVPSDSKPRTRTLCKIKTCKELEKTISGYCFECSAFPCMKMKHIDKRYTAKYRASLIGNLLTIKETGMDAFLKSEAIKWRCPGCGSVLSVHKSSCISCNLSLDIVSDKNNN